MLYTPILNRIKVLSLLENFFPKLSSLELHVSYFSRAVFPQTSREVHVNPLFCRRRLPLRLPPSLPSPSPSPSPPSRTTYRFRQTLAPRLPPPLAIFGSPLTCVPPKPDLDSSPIRYRRPKNKTAASRHDLSTQQKTNNRCVIKQYIFFPES